jgi:hemolysin activation/secretion protein
MIGGKISSAKLALGTMLVAIGGMTGASAQQLSPQIDPGAISRQTRETQGQAATPQPVPGAQTQGLIAPDAAPPIVFPEGGATFVLEGVVFSPSELLDREELDAIAAKFVGKEVDLAALQSIVNSVNLLYAQHGYVTASAVLPAQDLSTRILQVRLVEGRVGEVDISEPSNLRESFVRRSVPLTGGAVVDAPALTRDVDRFNRTSSAQIQASLQPGSAFGLTDINLAVIEPRRNTLQVFGDNLGVESVGKYEAGALFQHYGLLGFDDRLTGYGLLAEGNLFGSASYNAAVTPLGTRAGLSYSRSGIRVVGGPFAPLDITGAAEVFAANLSHPIYSGGPYLLLGNLAASHARSSTDQLGLRITDDRTRKGTAGFSASYLGQSFTMNVAPTVSFADAEIKITGEKLDYTLFQLTASASMRFGEVWLGSVRGSAQVASESILPGSDLFQIGGPSSVRGYPSSLASGDAGHYVNLELHRSFADIDPGLEGFVFLDRLFRIPRPPNFDLDRCRHQL